MASRPGNIKDRKRSLSDCEFKPTKVNGTAVKEDCPIPAGCNRGCISNKIIVVCPEDHSKLGSLLPRQYPLSDDDVSPPCVEENPSLQLEVLLESNIEIDKVDRQEDFPRWMTKDDAQLIISR